tara:strand:- start:120 stop:386 length:267 start_codon:yes stop_codon:yes gene_type:complete
MADNEAFNKYTTDASTETSRVQRLLIYQNTEIDRLKNCIERLENLFPAILLYLEDQADVVDGDNGIPAPNRAMSLLVWTKHALEGKHD